MLNHDTNGEIVFIMQQWTSAIGNTGPYILYAYTRILSIIREVKLPNHIQIDYSLLAHETERIILLHLHDFWPVIENALITNNPSHICTFLFELAKAFSSWYSNKQSSIVGAENIILQATRIAFIKAIAATLQKGLFILGISTVDRL